MKFPEIRGLIRRRVLVNFRVDPQVIQCILPAPFQPKLLEGQAMAGICLIRLEQIRPHWLPAPLGFCSENAAHRIAVCWKDQENQMQEGVYIPRRDSSSMINYVMGGRLFPGEHHRATFKVSDDGNNVDLRARAVDNSVSIDLRGQSTDSLPSTSLFSTLEEASDFYKCGSLGYSATASGTHLDGVVLVTKRWEVKPFAVEIAQSSYFSDTKMFPQGSVEFDCALIMRNIEHKWQAVPDLLIEHLDPVSTVSGKSLLS
jgi:hypothetical protein